MVEVIFFPPPCLDGWLPNETSDHPEGKERALSQKEERAPLPKKQPIQTLASHIFQPHRDLFSPPRFPSSPKASNQHV